LIERVDPKVALDLAIRMDSFVCGKSIAIVTAQEELTVFNDAVVLGDEELTEHVGRAQVDRAEATAERESAQPAASGSRLLDEQTRQRFREAIAAGTDNAELARQFGMTPRQANGLRMGLQKQYPHLRAIKITKPKRPELDRSTELQMQEAFLSAKPPAMTTLDDVVRFLRQRGDVVVSSADEFIIDGHRRMTPAELVARANAKRLELRLPPFADIWNVRQAAAQSATRLTNAAPTLSSSRPLPQGAGEEALQGQSAAG
jgi:hypothetical protein